MTRNKFLDIFRGLVRPVVTFSLVGATIWGFAVDKVSSEMVLSLTTTAVTFYFVDRQTQKMLQYKDKNDSE